ncbi:MAG: hypothetical protein ACRDE2_11025, partial [Chitinophagaceae bacterium]
MKRKLIIEMKNIVCYIITLLLLTTGYDAGCQSRENTSLKAYAPVPIGLAIGYFPMKYNQVYDSIVSTDFDNVTFDNALKNGSVVKP